MHTGDDVGGMGIDVEEEGVGVVDAPLDGDTVSSQWTEILYEALLRAFGVKNIWNQFVLYYT